MYPFPAKKIREMLAGYFEDNGLGAVPSARAIAAELRRRGCKRSKRHSARIWLGCLEALMGRLRPIGPFGWVVSWARAYVTETYGRALWVPIGPNVDFFAPGSLDHAGSCRDPIPPMSSRAAQAPDLTGAPVHRRRNGRPETLPSAGSAPTHPRDRRVPLHATPKRNPSATTQVRR